MNKKPIYIWKHVLDGKIIGEIHRFVDDKGKKRDIPYYVPDGKGDFISGIPPELRPYPLLGLDSIKDYSKTIYVCEGQKCQQTMATLGLQCLTSILGAGSAEKSDWTPLKKANKIILMPDFDDAGEAFMRSVSRILQQLNVDKTSMSIKVTRFPDLNSGGDVVDYLIKKKLAPKNWDGLKKLTNYSRRDTVRPKLRNIIRDLAVEVPEDWASTDPWLNPDMAMVNAEVNAPPYFPLEVLGKFWSEAVFENAEGCSAPVDYLALSLLVLASGLIGNARRGAPTENWSENSVLWGVIVGGPGSGKTHAINSILGLISPIQDRYDREYIEAFERWKQEEARIKKCKPKKNTEQWLDDDEEIDDGDDILSPKPIFKRLIVNDVTNEAAARILKNNHKGIISFRDEIAGLVGGIGKYTKSEGDRTFWLEGYNGNHHSIDRASNPDEPIIIKHLSIALLGGTQPDKLQSIIMSGDNDGLAARFLYVWPKRRPFCHRKNQFKGHAQALSAVERLVNLEMAENDDGIHYPIKIPFHGKAQKWFLDWIPKFENQLYTRSGMLEGHLAKYRGMAVRIALVLQFLWWSTEGDRTEPRKITSKAIKSAVKLLESYFVPMAIRAFADAAIPPAQRNASSLARWILKNKPSIINARNLYRKEDVDGLKDAAAVKEAISLLVEAGWLRPNPSREGGGIGRMKSDYEVNPRLFF